MRPIRWFVGLGLVIKHHFRLKIPVRNWEQFSVILYFNGPNYYGRLKPFFIDVYMFAM